MQRLPVNLLEADMVVARDVTTDKAIVLVAENTKLSEKLIFRLENLKIKTVVVKGTPVQLADYLPKTLERKLEDMEVGFSRAGDDPTMKKFRVLLKAHFIKRDEDQMARDQVPDEKEEREATIEEKPEES